MQHKLLLLVAVAAAAALLVPVGFAGTPKGQGLYGEHLSHCTGFFEYGTEENPLPVTLVPGNGNSFWVNGYHLVIQSATVILDTGETYDYTFGVKAGKASPDQMVTCHGYFPGYEVFSYDVVVP